MPALGQRFCALAAELRLRRRGGIGCVCAIMDGWRQDGGADKDRPHASPHDEPK
jgi:hypothetical protein